MGINLTRLANKKRRRVGPAAFWFSKTAHGGLFRVVALMSGHCDIGCLLAATARVVFEFDNTEVQSPAGVEAVISLPDLQ